MSVSGQVALVTGAAQGLGRAVAEELLKRGAKVGFCDMNESEGAATLKELSSSYGENRVKFLKCDITNQTQMEETFQTIKSSLGGLDIVVNNAGIGLEFTGWEKTVEVNVSGTIRGTQLAIEHMRKDKEGGNGGVIVNVSSMAGVNPNPCGPVYAATKAAINQYSLSWVANPELAQWGVRINVVCPAFVDTALFKNLSDKTTVHAPNIVDMITAKVGVMTPQFVAENVMTLIEDTTKNGAVMKISKAGGIAY